MQTELREYSQVPKLLIERSIAILMQSRIEITLLWLDDDERMYHRLRDVLGESELFKMLMVDNPRCYVGPMD